MLYSFPTRRYSDCHQVDDVEQTIPDSALMLRACGPIFSLQRRPPRHPAGARRTEIASLPLVRCPLQESKTMSKNRSEEHTSELQTLMRISYAVFCLKKKTNT